MKKFMLMASVAILVLSATTESRAIQVAMRDYSYEDNVNLTDVGDGKYSFIAGSNTHTGYIGKDNVFYVESITSSDNPSYLETFSYYTDDAKYGWLKEKEYKNYGNGDIAHFDYNGNVMTRTTSYTTGDEVYDTETRIFTFKDDAHPVASSNFTDDMLYVLTDDGSKSMNIFDDAGNLTGTISVGKGTTITYDPSTQKETTYEETNVRYWPKNGNFEDRLDIAYRDGKIVREDMGTYEYQYDTNGNPVSKTMWGEVVETYTNENGKLQVYDAEHNLIGTYNNLEEYIFAPYTSLHLTDIFDSDFGTVGYVPSRLKAAAIQCPDGYENQNGTCVDKYPYSKKHWTLAEVNKWLYDDNNTITITFKKQ